MGGNAFTLYSDTEKALAAIAADIDAARSGLVMVFYIWGKGGAADDVTEAVIRAARRGVACRLLIDGVGARPWWRSGEPRRLRAAGVEVREALPVGLIRSFVGRTDLRMHRKIIIIDGEVAWTGSMNMVDPRFFKTDAGVGEWVDAMVRLRGPVVAPVAATAISDWRLETGEPVVELVESASLHLNAPAGTTDMQVIPSGPGVSGDGLLQMMIALIDSARARL
ncbi:MAG: cardiolipin synthase A, partial [bacterium]|nr:cardiolipin synthase A [bacterium]